MDEIRKSLLCVLLNVRLSKECRDEIFKLSFCKDTPLLDIREKTEVVNMITYKDRNVDDLLKFKRLERCPSLASISSGDSLLKHSSVASRSSVAVITNQCFGNTKSGRRCTRKVKGGGEYCHQHSKMSNSQPNPSRGKIKTYDFETKDDEFDFEGLLNRNLVRQSSPMMISP